jgi:hypothetical protein
MTRRFDCTREGCHFSVASDDEGEVIHVVREHARDRHGMSVGDMGVRAGMRTTRADYPPDHFHRPVNGFHPSDERHARASLSDGRVPANPGDCGPLCGPGHAPSGPSTRRLSGREHVSSTSGPVVAND